MRKLLLDEKISIKGELAPKGVLPQRLAQLTTADAAHLYWVCFGRPVSCHSNPKMWRRRTVPAAFRKALPH